MVYIFSVLFCFLSTFFCIGKGPLTNLAITCNPPKFPVLHRIQKIRHQPWNVRSHAVPHQMQVVRPHSPRMLREVLHQLRYAFGAKPGRPFHLLETRFPHQGTVVHDDDVVVPHAEVGVAHIRAGGEVPAAPEAVNHHLRGVLPVELGIVQGLLFGSV